MNDHTAIDISLDPTQQHMKGITRHGGLPFDVPIISQVADHLWQGGCPKTGLILPSFINVVISLYPWEHYTINHDIDWVETVTMHDSLEQSTELVDELAMMANTFRAEGKNVLVHCQAGLNRSSLVVARAIMLDSGCTAREAIKQIHMKRSDACLCNPAFNQYLLSFDRIDEHV